MEHDVCDVNDIALDFKATEAEPKETPKTCTSSECIDDSSKLTVTCEKCKRKVHFACTRLPLYQLQLITCYGTSVFRKFTCCNCVLIKDADIIKLIPVTSPSDEILREIVDKQTVELKVTQEETMQLRKTIAALEAEQKTNKSKKRKFESESEDLLNKEIEELRKETASLRERLREQAKQTDDIVSDKKGLEREVTQMQEKNKQLGLQQTKIEKENEKLVLQKVETDRKHKHQTQKLIDQNNKANTLLAERETVLNETLGKQNGVDQTQDDHGNEKLLSLIENKLNNGLHTIQKNVEELINKKIYKMENEDVTMRDVTTPLSYAKATDPKTGENKTNSFKEIMMAAKNEELAEETERKLRCTNIVIHGKQEMKPEEDKEFIDDFIKQLCVGSLNVQKIERIGKPIADKNRPVKVSFATETEKEKVMRNLVHLKGNESYRGISVKDDFTFNERILIKAYNNEARIKNANEPADSNIIWRVRGSPKNGLSTKPFKKTQQDIAREAAKKKTREMTQEPKP